MGEIQKEEQKTQMFRYKNASLPTQERVNDLLSHMTLREKVGQLNQRLYGFRAYERKGDEITLTKETIEEAKYFGGLGVVCMDCIVQIHGQQRQQKTVSQKNMP